MKSEKNIGIIIKDTLSKNNNAEKKLYKYCKNKLIKYLRKNNQTIDEDLISETIIKIFTKLFTFNENKSSFDTWIITILKNTQTDLYRKNIITANGRNSGSIIANETNKNIYSLTFDNSSYDVDSTYNISYQQNENAILTNMAYMETFETTDSICYIADTITTEEFNLLNMHYIYNYSYNEMGQEFNITSSTVSNKVNYIKQKIKGKISCNEII